MPSRNIDDLHPKAAKLCREFIAECDKQGIDIIITSTLRTEAEQNELYKKGRSHKGPIVTNAKGGESYHNYAIAFDWVPIVHGKPAWEDTALFKKCGEIAESVGLEWAGRWLKMKELAHCQLPGYTIAQLKSGVKIV